MSQGHSNPWLILAGLLAAVVVAAAAWLMTRVEEQPPSVILVVIDTLRADALGCYLGDDVRTADQAKTDPTPVMDALAAEGIRFTGAYTTSPWTLPSFASLFTSTYPSEHGAVGKYKKQFFPIRKGLRTAAQTFKAGGYRTAAIMNNIFLNEKFGFAAGFDDYDFFPAEVNKLRDAHEVTRLAIRWLEKHGDEPYFLVVHYFDPHFPYRPPQEFRDRYGVQPTDNIRSVTHPDDIRQERVILNPFEQETLKKLYLAEVSYTDQELGALLDHVRKDEGMANTAVIVTSDHGEEFWDHGGFEHGHTQHEEVVRVPLIIRLPGKGGAGNIQSSGNMQSPGDSRGPGNIVEAPVRLMDLMPTLHELAGLASPATFQGESFLPLLQGGAPGQTRPIYYESCLYGPGQKALRQDKFKLILDTATEKTLFYDLSKDPWEEHDAASRMTRHTAQLKGALFKIMEDLKKKRKSMGKAVELSAEDMENLEKLGYLK